MGEIRKRIEAVESFDGTHLAAHSWEPAVPGNGPIALIHHGAAYHGGAYSRLGNMLARAGIPTMAPDARGHGLSQGRRGDMDGRDSLVRDLGIVADLWRERHAGRPLILIGESMGGLVALHHAADARATPGRADALVLSAPGILIHPQQVFSREALLAASRSLLTPGGGGIARPAERDRVTLQRNPNNLPDEAAESLALRSLSANYMTIIAGMSILSPGAANRIAIPTLILHGKRDDVVPYQGSHLLYHLLAAQDKQLVLYPDAGHTLFWSAEDAPVYTQLMGWLGERFTLD